ncbi:hypothetical protein LPB140_10565 [Sphingorhabdus lutea]|uniref:VOC domain-containing protein n=1 Tax=Sphingorhabdus lutea TaxID=1913578 RepID=A0A1L3JDI3_9SPHN|nr:VOC family protein [Sphingorhabdus lutea]APG63159.1 hypothetical protein LPB140_10565 [Sphingorhabdus lutea]
MTNHKNKHGDFIWYELMTSDIDGAEKFYGPLLNWTFETVPGSDVDYRIFSHDNTQIGGFLQLNEDMMAGGAKPNMTGYIAVNNVDECCADIITNGGAVLMPAWDIDGVGRTAFVTDPQGIPFYIMAPLNNDHASESFAALAPRIGHAAWNELSTTDQEGAKTFYRAIFGWVVDGDMDMGPMGKYEFWRHDFMIGAVMTKPDEMPVPNWVYYFRVVSLEKAAAIAKENGALSVGELQPIPGDEFCLHGIDPQGALFALVGQK